MDKIHDLIIIGSGPAGKRGRLRAAGGLDTVVIERNMMSGDKFSTRMKWITIPDFRESRVLILE